MAPKAGPRVGALWAMVAKDLRLLARDRVACFFTFVFPLLFGVLFGAVFSGVGGGQGPEAVPIALADADGSPAAAELAAQLAADQRLAVHPVPDAHAAREQVRTGGARAAVLIPQGFGTSAAMPFAGSPMTLEVWAGPSDGAAAAMLEGIATQRLFALLERSLVDPDTRRDMLERAERALDRAEGMPTGRRAAMRALVRAAGAIDAQPQADANPLDADAPAGDAGLPVLVRRHELSSAGGPAGAAGVSAFAISFPQAVLWGVMGCAAGFGLSLVGERTGGTMTRLRAAPIGRWHIVLAKALACLLTTLAVSAVLLAVAGAAFGVRPTSPIALAAAVLAVAVCFVGVMMLLASLGRTEASASGMGWAVLLTLAMIGGGAIPLAFMPPWLRTVGNVSPVKWGILAIEGGLWRGFSPAEMALPIGVLLAFAAATFTAGAVAFAHREAR